MRAEPRVDARDVEAVAALRQHADLPLPGRELRQADGALAQDQDLPPPVPGRRRGPPARRGRRRHGVLVGELRQRPERLLPEPFGRGGGGGGRRPAAGARAPGDGGEARDADERAKERGEDGDDAGVDGGERARGLGLGLGGGVGEVGVQAGVGLQEAPRRRRHWPPDRWQAGQGHGEEGVRAGLRGRRGMESFIARSAASGSVCGGD